METANCSQSNRQIWMTKDRLGLRAIWYLDTLGLSKSLVRPFDNDLMILHWIDSLICESDTSLNATLDCSSNRVLLLEAGPRDSTLGSSMLSWKIHMPAALMYNLCDDKYNWYVLSDVYNMHWVEVLFCYLENIMAKKLLFGRPFAQATNYKYLDLSYVASKA